MSKIVWLTGSSGAENIDKLIQYIKPKKETKNDYSLE